MYQMKKDNNKGITLIALIITIIVLLILAAVSLTAIIGDDGILSKAAKSKAETQKAEASERVNLEVVGSYDDKGNLDLDELNFNLRYHLESVEFEKERDSENYVSLEDDDDGITELPVRVKYRDVVVDIMGTVAEKEEIDYSVYPGEIAKSTKKDNYTDGEKTATVPQGFTPSENDFERRIDDGFVIYDIPEEDLDDIDWSEDGIESVRQKYNQFVWVPVEDYDALQYGFLDYKDNEAEQRAIEESIRKYNGFYIGRYETTSSGEVIKGQDPGVMMSLEETVDSSRALYPVEDVYHDAVSTSVYGNEWNGAMKFTNKEGETDSSLYGNYANYEKSIATEERRWGEFDDYWEDGFEQSAERTYENGEWKEGEVKLKTVADISLNQENMGVGVSLKTNKKELNNAIDYIWSHIAINNTGSVDTYNRVTLYIYYTDADGEKIKYSDKGMLAPEINLDNLELNDNILIDESAATEERTVFYYKNIVTSDEVVDIGNIGIETCNLTGDDINLCIEAKVDAVQTHNAEDGIRSAWGVNVDIVDGQIQLLSNFNLNANSKLEKLMNLNNSYSVKKIYFTTYATTQIEIPIPSKQVDVTGNNENWKIKNIYDLAGNAEEWIIENGGLARGGDCLSYGNEKTINTNIPYGEEESNTRLGYRTALYVE